MSEYRVPDYKCCKDTHVYGLDESIRYAKYPMSVNPDVLNCELTSGIQALAQTAPGEAHDQFLTGVVVEFDLEYTIKAWTEEERYTFINFISSQSTMHRIARFDLDESYIEYTDPRCIEVVRELIEKYNETKDPQDYAGLYECVKYMTGCSHTDGGVGEKFGLEVMQALNDKCKQWKEAECIDYSLYGSPIESVTYRFAQCLQKRFGVIEGITDRNYVTNSYHVPVFEEINAFDKLAIESKFQKLSPGGAISYVEVPNMNDNTMAMIQLIQFIYDNIMYAELNSKSDYCMVCGYDKEIKIITDEISGKLEWECPNCGNRDHNKMSVARRTCGYIGTNFWNQGRTEEIKMRVLHIDDTPCDPEEDV